jgi:hypothetical protein
MNYAVAMGSGVMIYIPSFIKFGSAIHKLIWGIHRQTHGHTGSMVIAYANDGYSNLEILIFGHTVQCLEVVTRRG